MKILIIILGLINGGYMLLDGIFVLIKGKYIGPEKPGPWASLFYKIDVDVFKLGPLFIFFGIVWLVWAYSIWTDQNWSFVLGLIISVLTLWYLPIGTLFSLVIFIVLLAARRSV